VNHLNAGLTIGAIVAVILLVLVALWAGFNWLVGPAAATVAVIVVVAVTIIATVIDWRTE
jgi:hypothetical protein